METPTPDFHYPYPRPALTVDAVVFTFDEGLFKVLLIRRADEPFKDCWAFPGGFVNEDETVESAVSRELAEETGLKDIDLQQFYTASAPGRDPRGWTVSVIFYGIVPKHSVKLNAGDDAKEAVFHAIQQIPRLAFDHNEILEKGLAHIKNKTRFLWIATVLLEKDFSENEFLQLGLQLGLRENDLHQRWNRFMRMGLIIESSEKNYYRFNEEKFKKSEKFE